MSPLTTNEIEGAGPAIAAGQFLLRGTSGELPFELNVAGEPKAPDEQPKVTIKRADGTTLVSEGTATGSGADYAFVLTPTQTASLDLLTATWSVKVSGVVQTFTTHHEIVGGFLTSVAAIRGELPNGVAPTAEEIEAARGLAEEWLEGTCGVAFRPRFGSETLDGAGIQQLLLSRPQVTAVRTVLVGGTAATGFTFSPSGVLRGEEPWIEGFQNVVVTYEHGFATVPSQVARAATLLARLFLVPDPSDYDGRATSISTETAHYTLITPGMREAITAIPEVNVVMSFFDFTGIA